MFIIVCILYTGGRKMDDRILVLEMIAYIEKNLVQDIGARDLVEYSGYSLNRLRQKFFKVTGETPSGYLRKRRLTEAAKEVISGEKIVDVCLKYGYSSQDNFTTAFRSYFGVTPKEIYTMDKKYKRFIARLREVYNIMELTELKQPPLCSTLMGCLKGAADYFDLDLTVPMLFGLSGHAFLINIHEQLCPSGPYVWNKEGFVTCLRNLGIEWEKQIFLDKSSTPEIRGQAEKEIINALNSGALGILEYMEYQLVNGYDESGFHFVLPWNGDAGSEQKRLTFSTWAECLDNEGFAGFIIIKKGTAKDDIVTMVKHALSYGLDLYRYPEKYQQKKYGIAYHAYTNWINCFKSGEVHEHGSWWNGMVWTENKKMAGNFFGELEEVVENGQASALCSELAGLFGEIGDRLDRVKEKDLSSEKKIPLLEECLEFEHKAEEKMEVLLKALE
jgi:AraC-like DNA-binding protein